MRGSPPRTSARRCPASADAARTCCRCRRAGRRVALRPLSSLAWRSRSDGPASRGASGRRSCRRRGTARRSAADYEQRIGLVNPQPWAVEYLVRSDLVVAARRRRARIGAQSRTTLDIASSEGAVDRVVRTSSRRRRPRSHGAATRDASLCAPDTRGVNIFPEGGRAATRAVPRLFERYVLYNPFPDLARASVQFVSPDETDLAARRCRTSRSQPGKFVLVDPEDAVRADARPVDDRARVAGTRDRRAAAAHGRAGLVVVCPVGRDVAAGSCRVRSPRTPRRTLIAREPRGRSRRTSACSAPARDGSLPEETLRRRRPTAAATSSSTTIAPRTAGPRRRRRLGRADRAGVARRPGRPRGASPCCRRWSRRARAGSSRSPSGGSSYVVNPTPAASAWRSRASAPGPHDRTA